MDSRLCTVFIYSLENKMGFRTTIISETKYIAWPDWFVKQYDNAMKGGER